MFHCSRQIEIHNSRLHYGAPVFDVHFQDLFMRPKAISDAAAAGKSAAGQTRSRAATYERNIMLDRQLHDL
jgi:hypothetical protein